MRARLLLPRSMRADPTRRPTFRKRSIATSRDLPNRHIYIGVCSSSLWRGCQFSAECSEQSPQGLIFGQRRGQIRRCKRGMACARCPSTMRALQRALALLARPSLTHVAVFCILGDPGSRAVIYPWRCTALCCGSAHL